MATRSTISAFGMTIYCHNDGYPWGVGAMLDTFYTGSEKKIMDLMNLGNISILGEDVSTTLPHSFIHPTKGVTVAYHRDRGEPLCYAVVGDGEYAYTYNESMCKWSCVRSYDISYSEH